MPGAGVLSITAGSSTAGVLSMMWEEDALGSRRVQKDQAPALMALEKLPFLGGASDTLTSLPLLHTALLVHLK